MSFLFPNGVHPTSCWRRIIDTLETVQQPWWFLAALALASVVSIVLQIMSLTIPYWFDEANTIHHVLKSIPNALRHIANDNQAPLYYAILYGWIRMFGTTEVVTALPSLFFNLLAAYGTFLLGRLLFKSVAMGMTAAVLYFVSFPSIYYATETRMYSLLAAQVVFSSYFLWRYFDGGRRWLFWYWLVALTGIYTHYLFFLVVYAHNIVLALFRRRAPGLNPFHWVCSQVLLGLAFLPWFPWFLQRFVYLNFSGASTWLGYAPRASLSQLWESLRSLQLPPPWPPMALAPLGVLALVVALVSIVLRRIWVGWRSLMVEWRVPDAAVRYALLTLLLPLAAIVGLHLNYARYVSFLGPLLACVLVAGARGISPRWLGYCTLLVLLVVSLGGTVQYLIKEPQFHYRYHWPAMAQFLERRERGMEATAILLPAAEEEFLFHYYYHGSLPVLTFFPTELRQTGDRELDVTRNIGASYVNQRNVEELGALVAGYRSLWLVAGWSERFVDPDGWVARWLEIHCSAVTPTFFPEPNQLKVVEYSGCAS